MLRFGTVFCIGIFYFRCSTISTLVAYPGEKEINGTKTCKSLNGSTLLDSCVYEVFQNVTAPVAMNICASYGGRLLNLPNASYSFDFQTLNITGKDPTFLGMQNENLVNSATSFYWIAGNTSYQVVYNKFLSTKLGGNESFAMSVFINGYFVWVPISGDVMGCRVTCQHPLKSIITKQPNVQPSTTSATPESHFVYFLSPPSQPSEQMDTGAFVSVSLAGIAITAIILIIVHSIVEAVLALRYKHEVEGFTNEKEGEEIEI